MKLQKLISKLEKHHKKKLDLSLGRTFNLLKKLGNPQDKLKNVVTVVGTNAKASMCYSLKLLPTFSLIQKDTFLKIRRSMKKI